MPSDIQRGEKIDLIQHLNELTNFYMHTKLKTEEEPTQEETPTNFELKIEARNSFNKPPAYNKQR